jgi:hypothetical protein
MEEVATHNAVPPKRKTGAQNGHMGHCRRIMEPNIAYAFSGSGFSIRVMLIASYFKISMRSSLESVSMTMNEIFGLRISEGEIQDMLYRLSDSMGKEYETLLDQIRKAPSMHMDTTSWRENGSNMDLWTFVTKGETIFHISRSNNHEVALDLLGKQMAQTSMTATVHLNHWRRRQRMISSTAGLTSYAMQGNWNHSMGMKAE